MIDFRHDNYSSRYTEAHEVAIGRAVLYFSYQTLIGVMVPAGTPNVRPGTYITTERHSNTTARHKREMPGSSYAVEVSPAELQRVATVALTHVCAQVFVEAAT